MSKRLPVRDFQRLYKICFNQANHYPGYKPDVIEAPDGRYGALDEGKHYAHVAVKYLHGWDSPHKGWMESVLHDWTSYAVDRAIEIGLPMKWWPSIEDSTIRILAYPPGAESHAHYDFDLFTLNMYRNVRETYERLDPDRADRYDWVRDGLESSWDMHYGELATIINPNFKPTKHRVHQDYLDRTQYAAVFFAMPRLSLTLPGGVKVWQWVENRKEESRHAADR